MKKSLNQNALNIKKIVIYYTVLPSGILIVWYPLFVGYSFFILYISNMTAWHVYTNYLKKISYKSWNIFEQTLKLLTILPLQCLDQVKSWKYIWITQFFINFDITCKTYSTLIHIVYKSCVLKYEKFCLKSRKWT